MVTGQVAGGKLINHVPINFAPQHSCPDENQRRTRIYPISRNKSKGGRGMGLEVSFANLFANDVLETGDQSI